MGPVNIQTEIQRPDGVTRYTWTGTERLPEMQHAVSALMLDLSNAGGQVAAGLLPPQSGPFDKSMGLTMTVTHPDGSAHHSLAVRYDNFSSDGIAGVMQKVSYHLAPFKASAQVHKRRH
jgi:hypothetical protein